MTNTNNCNGNSNSNINSNSSSNSNSNNTTTTTNNNDNTNINNGTNDKLICPDDPALCRSGTPFLPTYLNANNQSHMHVFAI